MQKPDLPLQVAAELERRGIDAVRMFLASQGSYKGEGTARDTAYRFGDTAMTRGQVEDWLKWKSAAEGRWIRVGAIAAIVAAILAAFGLVPIAAILAAFAWLIR